MSGQDDLTPRVPGDAMHSALRITGQLYTGDEICTDVELMRRVRDGLMALPDDATAYHHVPSGLGES